MISNTQKTLSTFVGLFKLLFLSLPLQQRIHSFILVIFSITAAVIEVAVVSSIIPFLSFLSKEDHTATSGFFEDIATTILHEPPGVAFWAVTFVLLTIIANISRVALLIFQTRLSQRIGGELANRVYFSVTNKSFEWHQQQKTSTLISNITIKINNVIVQFVNPLFEIASSLIILIGLAVFLIALNPYVIMSVLVTYSFLYLVVSFLIKEPVRRTGVKINEQLDQFVSLVSETLKTFKSIIIYGKKQSFEAAFDRLNFDYRKLVGDVTILALTPRYLFEAIGICMVAIIAYVMVALNQNKFETIIPFLGAFALTGQRIIPLMQRVYISITLIGVSIPQTKSLLSTIENEYSLNHSNVKEPSPNSKVYFKKEILLEQVHYREPNGMEIIKGVSLSLEKNKIIGIKGKTGSGKTTLVNVILGLLRPTAGQIKCDGRIIENSYLRNYQNLFSLVSQDLEIISMDARGNIAFSETDNHVDEKKLTASASFAEITHLLTMNTKGMQGSHAETEKTLSGGEKQRLSIARAFYADRDIIVLDELSSALDKKTEASIIQKLLELKKTKTLLIVTHSDEMLGICDVIFEMNAGTIVETKDH